MRKYLFANLEGDVFEVGPLSLLGVLTLIVLLFLLLYDLNGIFSAVYLVKPIAVVHPDCPSSNILIKIG